MHAELPEGFIWTENGIIKCLRCRQTEDCRGAFQAIFPDFIEDHRSCSEDRGLAPASSMTIREAFAMHIFAAMTGSSEWSREVAEKAVDEADDLLAALVNGGLRNP